MKTFLAISLLLFSLAASGAQREKSFEKMISAIDSNNVAGVRALLAKGVKPNLTVDSRAAPTFLTHSAYKGRNEIVRVLIAAGGDLEAANGDGYTPLMMAASSGHLETVRLLLDHKADVNATGFRGETPLSLARDSKNQQVISMLLNAGAKE